MGRFFPPLFANFLPQGPCCSFSQNISSWNNVELPRDNWCGGLVLEFPCCWNDEILNIKFQVGEYGVVWGGEEVLLSVPLKPYTSMAQICPLPHSTNLCSTLFDHHCPPWNGQELPVSGQSVVHTCSSSDSIPLVILIFPEACKINLRLQVSDLVILELVVSIRKY